VNTRRLLTMVEGIGKDAFTVTIGVKPNRALRDEAAEIGAKAFKQGPPALKFVNVSANM